MNASTTNSNNNGHGSSGGVDGTQPPVPSIAAASALTHASTASAASDGAESPPPATENDEMQLELDGDANEIPMQHDYAAMLHEADIAGEKKSGTEAEGNVPLLAKENEEMKLELDEEIDEAPMRDAQIASQFEADEKAGPKKKVELDEEVGAPMADAQIASQFEAGKKPAATAATSRNRGEANALPANQRSAGERLSSLPHPNSLWRRSQRQRQRQPVRIPSQPQQSAPPEVTPPNTLPSPTLEGTSPTNNNEENSPLNDEENPPVPVLEATLVTDSPPVPNVEATLIVPNNSPVYEATQITSTDGPWWKRYKIYFLVALVSLLIGGMATAIAMLAVGNSSNSGDEVNTQLIEQTPVTTVPEAEEDDTASDILNSTGQSPVLPPTNPPTNEMTIAPATAITSAPVTRPTSIPVTPPPTLPLTNGPTTNEPTRKPTLEPTTEAPTPEPTPESTPEPSKSNSPTNGATAAPTATSMPVPATLAPPTLPPANGPTTNEPTRKPTLEPTTEAPTPEPTPESTPEPSKSNSPTNVATTAPTTTSMPVPATLAPLTLPLTIRPTTNEPTRKPTLEPTTEAPTPEPTPEPSKSNSPTNVATTAPTTTSMPVPATLAISPRPSLSPMEQLQSSALELIPSEAIVSHTAFENVAMYGNTVIVGAPENNNGRGFALVFISDDNGKWSQQAKLEGLGGGAYDNFGLSVAIHGNTIIVGAYGDNDNGWSSGSVHVITRNGGTWMPQAKLLAPDGRANDNFGFSVGIYGDTVIVGAHGDDGGGSAHVFVQKNGIWTHQARLTAPDGTAGGWFGRSVGIFGDTVIVGNPRDDDNGSAHLFTLNGGIWMHQARLLAPDAKGGDYFGSSVGIFGETAIVGAPYDDDNGTHSGSAQVYALNNNIWTHKAKIMAPDGVAYDNFGRSVGIFADTIIVGSEGDDKNGFNSGSLHLFTRNENAWDYWYYHAKLLAPKTGKEFGQSVVTYNGTVVASSGGGEVYVFSSASD